MCSLIKGCTTTQFTCSNGQCVPLTARCNNINECADGSDEQNCGTVKTYYTAIFLNWKSKPKMKLINTLKNKLS